MSECQDLVACLEDELDARKSLLTSLFAMNDAIRQCDARKLQTQLAEQKRILTTIEGCAGRREAVVRRMAGETRADAPSPTLSSLAPELAPEDGRRVQTLRTELQRTCEETRAMNLDNEILLKSGLDIVEAMLGALLQEKPTARLYGRKGSPVPKSTKRSLFDTQA